MTTNDFVTKYLDDGFGNETSGGRLTPRAERSRERSYQALLILDGIVAAEREECAKLAESLPTTHLRAQVAKAIRERGQR